MTLPDQLAIYGIMVGTEMQLPKRDDFLNSDLYEKESNKYTDHKAAKEWMDSKDTVEIWHDAKERISDRTAINFFQKLEQAIKDGYSIMYIDSGNEQAILGYK